MKVVLGINTVGNRAINFAVKPLFHFLRYQEETEIEILFIKPL